MDKMSESEYLLKIKELDQEHLKAKRYLNTQYANSNNSYKKGDIVIDHIGSVRIERWRTGFSFSDKIPECVYFGLEVKKDHTPKVREVRREVWQSNIKI